MSTEVSVHELSPEQVAVLQRKQAAWNALAETVYLTELELQVRVQAQIAKMGDVTVQNLVEAEGIKKEVASELNKIIETRTNITGKFDAVKARMMEPEKELATKKTEYDQRILAAKKEHEKLENDKRFKADEIKRVKEQILRYNADHELKCQTAINEKASKAYDHALKADVKPHEIPEYVDRVKAKLGVVDFHAETPNINVAYMDPTEVNVLLDETFRNNPHAWVKIWHDKLVDTFSNYPVAYANKKDALALEEKRAAEEKAALEQSVANQKAAAEIEASAQSLEPTSVGPVVKAIKKVYELDMPDTNDSVLKIFAAFAANRAAVEPLNQVKNPLKGLTAESIGKTLCKLKNADNAVEFSGIHFKQIEKL